MSTLKVDTLQSTGGGATTFTKQQAIKTWVNYDAADQATRGSFGQSSLADNGTGDFTTSHSSNFSSAEDKCVTFGCWNTGNEGSSEIASAAFGHLDTVQAGDAAQSTSSLNFHVAYGSSAGADGAASDTDGNYVSILGDLA